MTLRRIFAIARSSWRTPASWVYSVAIDPEGIVVDADLVGDEAGSVDLAGTRWLPGDGDLLVLGVAVEADELHAVEQRRPGSCRPRWPWPGRARRTGRARSRGSGRGRCGSAPGRAPRAAPTPGRPGSRCRACRSRRAGRPGSSSRLPGSPARCARAARRRRCAGGRGSPPRHERRRARRGRTCARARGRRTRRARSCRPRAGRPGRARRRSPGRRRTSSPRACATAPNGEVLDDAVLDVVETLMVGVEDLRVRP